MFAKQAGLYRGIQWEWGELTPDIERVIEQVIEDFTYKDGWVFSWVRRGDDQFWIQVEVTFPSNRPGLEEVTVEQLVNTNMAPVLVSPVSATLTQLRLAIWSVEVHEMNEHCLYKGERLWDPHRRSVEHPPVTQLVE